MIQAELKELGFDEWFQDKLKDCAESDLDVARVTAVNRDSYLITNGQGEATAELSGRFRFSADSESEFPTVGDWVLVTYFDGDTFAVIEDLLPRKTAIKRKVAGKKIDYQVIGANIDFAFIVQSCNNDFNLRRLERYLVAVREGGIEPVILLSKSDLPEQAELDKMLLDIREAKIKDGVIAYSIKSGFGLDDINQLLAPGKTFCLLGSSGVGKTTLINHFTSGDDLNTGEVRLKNGKGKHTTTRRQMIILDNKAMLIDTPGLREFGNIDTDAGIADVFPDIEELASGCRFKDCSHTTEAGCSVLQALDSGELSQERYESYLKLSKESAFYQLSYAEKRKKDKKLGQFYKTALKTFKGNSFKP